MAGIASGTIITPALVRPFRAGPRTATFNTASTSFSSDLQSVSVTGDGATVYGITAFVPGAYSTVAGDRVEVGIFAAGTQIGGGFIECATGVANAATLLGEYTPGASAVTISIRIRRAGGTGTCTYYSSNLNPGLLWVAAL